MKRVFLYVRVSTKEQAEEGYSIKEQEVRLRAYAKAMDYVVVKVYVDPGYSGANIKRPAMQEMIKEIKNADLVLVYKLDRLSRSQKDTLYLIEDVFLKNNVNFNSMSESFDTSTPFGRAMIGILSVFAQLEREQIRERLTMGRVARAKEGYYHGGDADKAPTGYDYVEGNLIINEYEASCVRYIFDEYLKGKGFGRIFDDIEKKFPNVVGDLSTVRKILKRSIYKGVVVFAGEEYEGKHEPIVTKKEYEEVQKLMSKRSVKFDSTPNQMYILSGLIYCGHCGARMAGKAGKKLKSGETMKYYVCYTRRGTPKHMMNADDCDKSFERKEKIEQAIINELKKINLADVETKNEISSSDNKIKVLESQMTKIDTQISKTVDLFTLDNIPMDVLTSKIESLNADKKNILKYIDELKGDDPIDTTEIKKIIPTLSNLDKLSLVNQQSIIIKLVDKITVSNDKMEIDWHF